MFLFERKKFFLTLTCDVEYATAERSGLSPQKLAHTEPGRGEKLTIKTLVSSLKKFAQLGELTMFGPPEYGSFNEIRRYAARYCLQYYNSKRQRRHVEIETLF